MFQFLGADEKEFCETDIFWYLLDPSLVITQGEMRHTHNVYEIPFKALIKFSDMEQL